MSRSAAVVVASTRAANGVYVDRTGPIIVEWLRTHDYEVGEPTVVEDGPDVAVVLRAALALDVDLLVTTGGTGVGQGDVTPEATAAVIDREVPGFGEELRRRGAEATPFAILSRGIAGVAGRTFVVNLPGSTGGVRDGLTLLGEVADHVFDQLAGGSHD